MKQKCFICKSYIIISDYMQDDYLYDLKKKNFYHYDCIFQQELEKQTNKKRGKILSEEEIDVNLRSTQEENKKIIKQMLDEERLYNFIHSNYGLVSIPKSFDYSLKKVFSGEYKGLSKGIPVEDILDMWQRKKRDLDNIYEFNKRKGKDIDKAARLNYDLAVLVGKYDSYLEWKNKEATRDDFVPESLLGNIICTPKVQTDEKSKNEIAEYLDDLF